MLRPIALAGKHATVKVAAAAITAALEWARINEFRAEGSPVETVRRGLPKRAGRAQAPRRGALVGGWECARADRRGAVPTFDEAGDGVHGADGGAAGEFAESFPAVVNWISTSRLSDRGESRSGDSYENPAEAGAVVAVLDRVSKDDGWRGTLRVGVITGYSGQVGRLRGAIDTGDSGRWPRMAIDIATVDSFQGRECDVVIYSTVRSNAQRRIGFLREHRRLNVALSRARDLLVIVGDDFMMENAVVGGTSNPFANVLAHMRSNPDECRIEEARP